MMLQIDQIVGILLSFILHKTPGSQPFFRMEPSRALCVGP